MLLKSLNLGNVIENFEREKISPDIICRMDRHDFINLGVIHSEDMMKIRIATNTYGSIQPPKHIGHSVSLFCFVFLFFHLCILCSLCACDECRKRRNICVAFPAATTASTIRNKPSLASDIYIHLHV